MTTYQPIIVDNIPADLVSNRDAITARIIEARKALRNIDNHSRSGAIDAACRVILAHGIQAVSRPDVLRRKA